MFKKSLVISCFLIFLTVFVDGDCNCKTPSTYSIDENNRSLILTPTSTAEYCSKNMSCSWNITYQIDDPKAVLRILIDANDASVEYDRVIVWNCKDLAYTLIDTANNTTDNNAYRFSQEPELCIDFNAIELDENVTRSWMLYFDLVEIAGFQVNLLGPKLRLFF